MCQARTIIAGSQELLFIILLLLYCSNAAATSCAKFSQLGGDTSAAQVMSNPASSDQLALFAPIIGDKAASTVAKFTTRRAITLQKIALSNKIRPMRAVVLAETRLVCATEPDRKLSSVISQSFDEFLDMLADSIEEQQ